MSTSPKNTTEETTSQIFNDDQPRTPKRTPMACQFCRGRKLKCDGMRPSCANCHRRGYPCNYTPVNAATPKPS